MKDITISMLKGKIEANRKRISDAERKIEEMQGQIERWGAENASFSHCMAALESGMAESDDLRDCVRRRK